LTQLKSRIKLNPKCVFEKEPAFTASGFFLPCCWCDRKNKYFKEKGFLNQELHISNVDDIVSEIFNSQIWIDFFNEIQYGNDYPAVCEEHCGINKITNKKIKK
jgi:hypothetical protein